MPPESLRSSIETRLSSRGVKTLGMREPNWALSPPAPAQFEPMEGTPSSLQSNGLPINRPALVTATIGSYPIEL